jgi:hypothetical protein
VHAAAAPAVEPVREAPPPEAAAPPATENAQSADEDDSGDVTPTLEGRTKGGKRGLVILQLGDSHTSADFLTGELRKRLQARYGRGGPGYITAGHPHIGVRTSSLTVKASKGWTYKSLQRPDAETAQFWLSGYNAIASAAGETMSFASEKPQLFDTIEIEVAPVQRRFNRRQARWRGRDQLRSLVVEGRAGYPGWRALRLSRCARI